MQQFNFQYGLYEAIDGLFAYQHGDDSGIHDPNLLHAVKNYLKTLTPQELTDTTQQFLKEYLSEDYGYEEEHRQKFQQWIKKLI